MERELDVVVFGATGDTGVAGCCCLYFKARRLGISSWAPAARNLDKLKKDVLDRIHALEPGLDGLAPHPPIQADSTDHASLVRMCNRAKCIISCAGPFALFGEGVIKACVEAGTHYVDVTGEMHWVGKMHQKYGAEAERKGIRFVCCAGYDSVPPDLATCLGARALERVGQRLGRFDVFVGGAGGAMPTGTINTVVLAVGESKRRLVNACTFGLMGQKQARPRPSAAVADVNSASSAAAPVGEEFSVGNSVGGVKAYYVAKTEQDNLKNNFFWTMIPGYSGLAGEFCLPHVMASINTHTVHHTAAKEGYGGLIYRERMNGLPNGLLSLYGLVPTLTGVLAASLLGVFMALPGGLKTAVWLRDRYNPPLQEKVRAQMLDGFASTGKTSVRGFGAAKDGSGTRVRVTLNSAYDVGIGFTMLSACTVASQLVKQAATPTESPKFGFNSAVVTVGPEVLADALRSMGVSIKVDVIEQGGSLSKL